MEDFFSGPLLEDLLFPFLDVRSFLTFSCVSNRFNGRCVDYSGDVYFDQHQPDYFLRACRALCSNDRTTFAGLLSGTGIKDDPPPSLLIRERLRRDAIQWLCRRDAEDDDGGWSETASDELVIFDIFKLYSWKALCLKLLHRIESIEKRKPLRSLVPPRKGGARRSIFGGWNEPIRVTVLMVGGTAYEVRRAFFSICNDQGLPESAIYPCGMLRGHRAVLSWPSTSTDGGPVDWSLHSTHYGPAGYEPHEDYTLMLKLGLSKLRPDMIVWTIPLRAFLRETITSTPYHFSDYGMANRVCLRDFILARECPCRVLLVLIVVDGLDAVTSQEFVANRLRLSSLTPLGISWHVQFVDFPRRENAVLAQMDANVSEGLKWALSELTS